jgi:L-alanine-DL-glutamate epimerase-like enolase superfamily enzyme
VRISEVQARAVRVPLAAPLALSTRAVPAREYTLVRVRCSDGVEGIGFNYTGTRGARVTAAAVRELLAPVLIGQDPHRTEGLWQEMYQEVLLQGRAGLVMRAISALDTALWDRNARSVGLPLYRYLGAVENDRVRAYASGGYYFEGKTVEDLADEARAYVDRGFRAVKIKVGRLDPAQEEKRVAAVREAIGADVDLMLDANNAWRDVPAALRWIRRFEAYDPFWIEEPFSPDDIDNHARLARKTSIPVATSEIEAGRWRHRELLEKEAAAFLQTDAAVAGGITEFRRIAATAASYGVPVCPHWFHDLHAQLVAATPNAPFVEYFPDSSVHNFRDLIDRQLEVKDGDLLLPTEPGLGFSFDPESVERYALDGWA